MASRLLSDLIAGGALVSPTVPRSVLSGLAPNLSQSTTCCCYWQYDARISPEYLVSVACQSRGLARALTEPFRNAANMAPGKDSLQKFTQARRPELTIGSGSAARRAAAPVVG